MGWPVARVAPSLMVAPPAVQLMSTTVPPGNGLVSVRVVTWAGKSPMFSTAKLQVMVWPSVAATPGQSLSADAPVPGSVTWACARFADDKRAGNGNECERQREWPGPQCDGHRFRLSSQDRRLVARVDVLSAAYVPHLCVVRFKSLNCKSYTKGMGCHQFVMSSEVTPEVRLGRQPGARDRWHPHQDWARLTPVSPLVSRCCLLPDQVHPRGSKPDRWII